MRETKCTKVRFALIVQHFYTAQRKIQVTTVFFFLQNACPSGVTCLPTGCFSVSYHYKNPTKRGGLVHSGPHHHLIEN
jgi:hypothetical protein